MRNAYIGIMLPHPTVCRRARLARDPRFDGRFVVAVLTTGVFCRPVCPARPAREENARYFATPAAALQAGYRPCLRCRPERASSAPEWCLGSETVLRAARLIEDGFLAGRRVQHLAERFGIGERQLNRLFRQELGATPTALARMRRIALAKRLLDDSGLAATEVAFAAGYASVRRFNEECRSVFGRSPGELRRLRQSAKGAAPALRRGAGASLRLQLPIRMPFNADWTFSYLARRALPGLEAVSDRCYRRRIGSHWASVRLEANGLRLQAPVALLDRTASLLGRVRRLFDLDADPCTIDSHLEGSPDLAVGMGGGKGIRVPGAWAPFEGAVKAILGQQVSVDRSIALSSALVGAYGEEGFPTPAALADADVAAIGLPGKRGAAVRGLARAVLEHGEDFLLDAAALRKTLPGIAGIGPWTTEYVAMRVSRDPNAFPASDWAIMKALQTKPAEAVRRAEPWQPWRAYAVMYLWRGLQQDAQRKPSLRQGMAKPGADAGSATKEAERANKDAERAKA